MPEPARGTVLIHIGYHRTASTWLQHHLFCGKKTGLGLVPKAADDDPTRRLIGRRWSEFDPEKIRARFDRQMKDIWRKDRLPVVSFERLSGHASSGGYDSAEIADRLRRVFPEGRVLIVIREQRSAIVSNYKRYVKAGGSGTPRQYLFPPTTSNTRLPTFDFRHFEYHHLISRYRKLFGDDGVLVLTFEQFVEDPRSFVAAIGEFGGRPLPDEVLDALPYDWREQVEMATSSRLVLRHLNKLVASDVNPTPFVDLRCQHALKQVVRSRVVRALVAPPLARRHENSLRRLVEEAVGDRYRESNRMTAQLTGLDLARYGYAV